MFKFLRKKRKISQLKFSKGDKVKVKTYDDPKYIHGEIMNYTVDVYGNPFYIVKLENGSIDRYGEKYLKKV